MMHPLLRILTLLALVIAAGCTHAPPATQPPTPPAFPLALQGANGLVSLDFDSHPAMTVSYELGDDEFCYMPVGDGLLICAQDGSYLMFGPDDGIVVVKDNPVYQLHPAGNDPAGLDMIHEFGTLTLLAASADRLPDALSAYLESPGPHRRQAMALARKLLQDNGGLLIGAARGGTFSVTLRLNADARQVLLESLQSEDNSTGIYRIGNKFPGRGDFPFIKRRFPAVSPLGS